MSDWDTSNDWDTAADWDSPADLSGGWSEAGLPTSAADERPIDWLIPVAGISVLVAALLWSFEVWTELYQWYLAYPLASLVPFTLVAIHRRATLSRQLAAGDLNTRPLRRSSSVVLVAGLVVTFLCVLNVALYFA